MVTKISKEKSFKLDEKSLKVLNLFRGDYTRSLHIREMARIIGLSHRTVLLHLQKLEQTAILTKKTIGRAVHYSLNKDNILTKIAMEMTENYATICLLKEQFIIKNILTEIEEKNAVQGCIALFGSWTKGYADETSDIDLLIIGKLLNKKIITDIQIRTGKRLNIKEISFKDFKNAVSKKDSLIKEIVASHVILKQAGIFVDEIWGLNYGN